MPIECMFCFIYSELCINIISLCKKSSLFSSVFEKIIPNDTTITFQKSGSGNLTPHILSMAEERLMASR